MVRCLLNLDLGARWLHSYVALISISLLGSITTTTRWMSTWTRSPARAARPAPCPTLGASGHCGCGCAGCMPICGERRVSGCGGRYSGAHRSIDHVPRASLVGNVLALVVREETLLLRKVALWREIRRVMQPRVPHGRDLGRVKVLVGVLDPAIATCAHAPGHTSTPPTVAKALELGRPHTKHLLVVLKVPVRAARHRERAGAPRARELLPLLLATYLLPNSSEPT